MCCVKYQAPLTISEIRRISTFLGLTPDEFTLKYTDSRWPGTDKLLAPVNGQCPFLSCEPSGRKKDCTIHNVRPAACSGWAPGLDKSECREGLLMLWQLTVSDSGQLSGTREQITIFSQFLETLAKAK